MVSRAQSPSELMKVYYKAATKDRNLRSTERVGVYYKTATKREKQ